MRCASVATRLWVPTSYVHRRDVNRRPDQAQNYNAQRVNALSAVRREVCLSGIDLVQITENGTSFITLTHRESCPSGKQPFRPVEWGDFRVTWSFPMIPSSFHPQILMQVLTKGGVRWSRLRFKCTVILESHCTGIFQELGQGQWTMNPNENQRPAATNPDATFD